MFERYTENARGAIFFARYEASCFGSPEITTEHILLGLLRADEAFKRRFLPRDAEPAIRKRVEEHSPPKKQIPTTTDLPLSTSAKSLLAYAAEEAERQEDNHIGIEHLLLSLLGERECLAGKILRDYGLRLTNLREEFSRSAPPPPGTGLSAGNEFWAASYQRKAQATMHQFYWTKQRCTPREALIERATRRAALYSGQTYDPAEFDLAKQGWLYDHCAICWRELLQVGGPDQGFGYTNGQDWLCSACYENFVVPNAG